MQEVGIHLVPNCLTHLFSQIHIGVITVYLLKSLLKQEFVHISSHGYVKDIL